MKTKIINTEAMIACMKAFLDPLVIPDGDFVNIANRTRAEFFATLETWPVKDGPTAEQVNLASQSTWQLVGYPHCQHEYIEEAYGISPEQIRLLMYYWDGWKDGASPADMKVRHDTPLDLHPFGQLPNGPTKPRPQTPIFLRVDKDIAEFFKEGTRKESYRRLHAALREFVDARRT